MRENLVHKVDECGQDNLIARLFPRAMTTAVMIVAGSGAIFKGRQQLRLMAGQAQENS